MRHSLRVKKEPAAAALGAPPPVDVPAALGAPLPVPLAVPDLHFDGLEVPPMPVPVPVDPVHVKVEKVEPPKSRYNL